MGKETHPEQLPRESSPYWHPLLRIAFRFCVIYFGLLFLPTQIFGSVFYIPIIEVPELSTLWPSRQIVVWTAAHVFRVKEPLVYTGSGSGDKTFDWVLSFCLLVIATLGAAMWSALDRKRPSYPGLYKWSRLILRFALLSQMLVYGVDKAVPLQMPFPHLNELLKPFGTMSPMGVLWSSVGASPPYEIFAGCAEILAGVLLLFPRTTTFGAVICLADMIEIFMLNMTYDVPVKLFAFHLIVMAALLLAPEFSRLANFFFLDRAVARSQQSPLFSSRRANRIALILQVSFGLLLLAENLVDARDGWFKYGGGRTKSPLYGIWDVAQFLVDGQSHAPLLNDWRRAIFDYTNEADFQLMDNSFASYRAAIDVKAKTLALSQQGKKNSTLTFQRPLQEKLILDGALEGHQLHVQLQLFDRNKFTLVNRGFHWIQEYPFSR